MTWIRGIQVTAILLLTGVAANAQLLRDDFDVLHDYSTGTVPAGGIWSGVHNSTNGGDAVTPGFFVANGTDAFGGSKAGVLFIEDLNLHANTNGNLGTGWEPAWTNAPFLYTEVPADKNFEVTTKIDNQTTGFWASSGILARVKGDPVGQGLGDAISGFNSAAVASFYPAEDNHQIQLQIIRPNETGTAAVEDENNAAVPVAGIFPLYLRMVKEGPTFTSWASEDGTNWSQYNGLEVNAALAESGKTLEVGLYNTRYGGSAGDVDFDFFEINITDPVTVTSATWIVDSAGNWNNFANWDANVAGAIPNNNQVAVLFGSAITAPKTVYSDSAVAAKSITFDNANKYAVAGTGGVTLAANTGSASLIVSQGSHEFQTSLTLASNTTANAAANTKLDINNTLDLGGHTLTISGGGQVNINNDVVSGNGGQVNSSARIGGVGLVDGGLTNTSGGVVAPGKSGVGTLSIAGDYVQQNGATLAIDIDGTGVDHVDLLSVGGSATLDGAIDVTLLNGFAPANGSSYTVLSANSVVNQGVSLTGVNASLFSLLVNSTSVVLNVGVQQLAGDYNGNGAVDAADYTVWKDNFGSNSNLAADGNGNGVVDAADYTVWKDNFGSQLVVAAASAVPEPGCWVMLLTAAALALPIRRRRAVG